MKKILFILPTLEAGGAERIITFISQNLNTNKFDCQLLVIGYNKSVAYNTDQVKTHFLNKSRVLVAIPAIIGFIRKEKPNIVVSSIGHLNTIMGLVSPVFPKTKFVIREASVISALKEFEYSSRFYDLLAKIGFPKVDAVICQSHDMAADFSQLYNLPFHKLHIINNPITGDVPKKSDGIISSQQNFITIGRLSQEKGHERLLRILHKLDKNFTYTIIGKGPEKETIFAQIKNLNLESKVKYVEYTKNVNEYLTKNDMFLQGSFVEGFPNAVLESCSVGTPVIAFLAPGGTREIIDPNVNGYLVETEEAFLEHLKNPKTWKRQQVIDSVSTKFAKSSILAAYEELFDIL